MVFSGSIGVSQFAPQDFQEVKGSNFLAGFRAGLQRDSRDSYLRPTQGSLLSLSYEECVGDKVFPLVNAEFLARLPNSRLDIIDAGHFTWEDAADEYAALVTNWWRGGYREGERT